MRPEAGDVTDAQWAALEPHAGRRKRRGPKSRVDPRLVVNAIFDRMRTGCRWRMPPKEYGSRPAAEHGQLPPAPQPAPDGVVWGGTVRAAGAARYSRRGPGAAGPGA